MKRRPPFLPVPLAAVLVAISQAAAAQPPSPDASPPDRARDESAPMSHENAELAIRTHLGVSTSPFYVPSLPTAQGHAVVLLTNGRLPLRPGLAVAVRVPVVFGSVAQPAGAFVDTTAAGNPMLELISEWSVGRVPYPTPTLSLGCGIGAPWASYDSALISNRALAIADGVEGRGHPEWFTPGVLPLIASLRLDATWSGWNVAAGFRVPALVRVSDASLVDADTRAFALASVFDVTVGAPLSKSLSLEVTAHLFVDVLAPARYVRAVSRIQDFERLGLYVALSSNTKLGVELQTAASGAIGGSMVAGGLTLAAAF